MKRGTILNCILLTIFAIVTEIFALLCLSIWDKTTIAENRAWIAWGISLAVVLLYSTGLVLFLVDKEAAGKVFLLGFLCAVVMLPILYICIRTGILDKINSIAALREYLRSAGAWMPVLFITLQFLQVVLLPIPGFVTVAAGVALFGPLLCTVYSLIGILLGSVTAFLIGRYVGYRAVGWIVGEESLSKWMQKLRGKDLFILTAMFILPLFPDDILCFIAGLSSMSTAYFLGMILVSRIISVATSAYSVDLIPFNTWWGILIWAVLIAVIITLFVLLYKNMDAIQAKFCKPKPQKITQIEGERGYDVRIVTPNGDIVEKTVQKIKKDRKK